MQTKLNSTIDDLIGFLYEYWRDDVDREGALVDRDLDRPSSCATAFQVAALCLAAHQKLGSPDALQLAQRITTDAAKRQNEDGSFGQPYYVLQGDPDTIDIAEIGAAGRALFFLAHAGMEPAGSVLRKAADFLVSQAHPTMPGVVYKRPDATHHDVLNGDAYAGDTFYWTYALTHSAEYRKMALDVIRHLADRFGRSQSGWWPYAEDWEGRPTLGNNVAYQGTVIAFTAPWYAKLEEEGVKATYKRVLQEAMEVVVGQVQVAPEERDEDRRVWWAVQDRLTWETALACWHMREAVPSGAEVLADYLGALHTGWREHGATLFDPAGETRPDAQRSVVTSRFRRLATASGALAYMALG